MTEIANIDCKKTDFNNNDYYNISKDTSFSKHNQQLQSTSNNKHIYSNNKRDQLLFDNRIKQEYACRINKIFKNIMSINKLKKTNLNNYNNNMIH